MKSIRWTCLVTIALAFANASDAQPPGKPQTYRPEPGEYQHLWLSFAGDETARAFVGLREGRSTVAWLVDGTVPGGAKKTGAYRVLVDRQDVAIKGDSLNGAIVLRQVSIWAPMQLLAQVTLNIDAKRTKDGFVGKWTSDVAGKKSSGAISATLIDEKSIRTAQPFTSDADWPSYHGPHQTNRAAQTPSLLVDDLSESRPVWRAEMPMQSGWGTGVDSRYTWRAPFGTVCGGSGTPVVAQGRVYLFHYAPSGEPDAKLVEKVLGDFEKQQKRQPSDVEREALINYCRPLADTIITCLDAQTGAVLWSVRVPFLSGNYQTHKWRGLNPTALVTDGVVIANDYASNWVALNATTGEVLWTLQRSQKVESNQAAVGAVRAGALAILPAVGSEPATGVDPRTGKVVWQQPGGRQALVWGKPGGERVLFLGGKAPVCHEAASGKLLWTMTENLVGSSGSAALIQGDILVGHVIPDPKKQGGFFQGWKLSDTGAEKIWQEDFLAFDENLTVTLGSDRAFLVGRNEIRSVDLVTGKLLGKQVFDEKTNPIGSNQWLALVGDRLLLSPEGQHGSQGLQWLDAKGDHKALSPRWAPPNNSTTAYAVHSLGFPIVDGRLFVRGMDGIYCYDLRKVK